MSGLLDGLTDYLRAAGAGVSGNSPLAAGLAGFSKASRARGLASGLSDYANAGANDAEAKRAALARMANADPEQTMNFIVKNKIADNGLVNTNSPKGEFASLMALKETLPADDSRRGLIDARLNYLSNNPNVVGEIANAKETGRLNAQAIGKPQVINASTPALAEQKSKVTDAEEAAKYPYYQKQQDYLTEAEKTRKQNAVNINYDNAERMLGIKQKESHATNTGKQQAERESSEYIIKKQTPVVLQAIDRVLKSDLASFGSGTGIVEGIFPPISKQAGINAANIDNAYAAMNILMRSLLKAAGITGKEMDAVMEANAYRYVINRSMPATQIRQTLDNFKRDLLSGDLEKNLLSGVNGVGQTESAPSLSKDDALAELKRRGLI